MRLAVPRSAVLARSGRRASPDLTSDVCSSRGAQRFESASERTTTERPLVVLDGPWRCSLSVLDFVPDLVPKYMVTIGTRWYLLGLAAAPPYQRVPIVTNSHKHNQDSNSLGGTIEPQVRGLRFPVACLKSGDNLRPSEGSAEGKVAAHRPFLPRFVAQESLLLRISARHRVVARFVARLHWLPRLLTLF